jgi:biopolymer transport protein ExbB
MSIFELIIKGGVLMIPISLCSVFALGIIVERMIHFRKAGGNADRLKEKLEPLIIGNKVSEGRLLCEETGGAISNVFRVALQELQREPDMSQPVEDEIEVTRRVIDEELQVSILPALEKHLNALDTLARGTPLLGLLGTVLGMIRVFFTIGVGQTVPDPSVLAKGIGLALITTAAGLIVAIPAFFMHRYFVGKVDYHLEEAQKAKGWLLAQLAKRRLITMAG